MRSGKRTTPFSATADLWKWFVLRGARFPVALLLRALKSLRRGVLPDSLGESDASRKHWTRLHALECEVTEPKQQLGDEYVKHSWLRTWQLSLRIHV
jgi:hypothetical protein